jgi:hypothetical protein
LKDRQIQVQDMIAKNKYFIMANEAELAEKKKEEDEKRSKIDELFSKFDISDDLNDEMDNLACLIQEFTNATGCYIGKLVPPRKEIGEMADDNAHIDDVNPKVIMYTNASKGHEFMVEKVLRVDQGLTHDVFKDPEPAPYQDEYAED